MQLFLLISLLLLTISTTATADDVQTTITSAPAPAPLEKKKTSMSELAPPLELDASCRVVECYRNMLNMSNSCKKSEKLHSFKKCEKKFYREEICCSKKNE
uniref:Uncharacterized protein n=1 Tax=Caenorhabditis japonica TaxID=281687 RepID=A0A8R1DXJ6_CAEJA